MTISKLKQDYVEKTGEAESLKFQLTDLDSKIAKSKQLLSSLDMEKTRWKEKAQDQ